MIIICYDGSEDAQAAADQAIRLFHEAPATVLTVWGPDAETLMNSELGLGSGFGVGYNRSGRHRAPRCPRGPAPPAVRASSPGLLRVERDAQSFAENVETERRGDHNRERWERHDPPVRRGTSA